MADDRKSIIDDRTSKTEHRQSNIENRTPNIETQPQKTMQQKLDVWKVAHELVLRVYKATEHFPKAEQFGLINQVRRSAASIPANIVEGQARHYKKEYIQFLYISRASAEETHYHLFLSRDLGYLDDEDYKTLEDSCIRIKMMLNKLIKSIDNR